MLPETPQSDINDILDKIKPIAITNNPQPTPINPTQINPTQINPTVPTEPTPTWVPPIPIWTESTPTNINPPIPQYNPNPQTEESHLIPEIFTDSNISTPIHDNHYKHGFKNVQKNYIIKL